MVKKFKININGKNYWAQANQTILEIAKENKIEIPALCYHSDLEPLESCRLCLVKEKNKKELLTACSLKAQPKMKIITDSPEIERARKINLELLFAQHAEECHDCVWSYQCQLLELAKKYKIKINRFPDRKKDYPIYQIGPAFIFESAKCIDCRNCVEICQNQGVGFLKLEKKFLETRIIPSRDKNKDCIYCGQCLVHCPAGSFEGVGEFEDVEKPFLDKSKTIVVQFAPSIRTSIGEGFGLPVGNIVTNKLVAGIKKLGAKNVFDVSVGADFTTIEEANELVEALRKKRKLPIFTSCCPAWVKFIEFYFPEFIPCLTTVRSPHIILGGLIKTYWAEKQKIDPKNIIIVSIMPCIAKKYEITRDELKINGLKPVDYVLTTRELIHLFKKRKIDFKRIKPVELDMPFGIPSGAGVIYGATGGVMESALRTVQKIITGKKRMKVEFKQVRGMKGVKEAKIKIGKKILKVAVINGTGEVSKILMKLKKNLHFYDYLEVMACPGGCVGGGGQPLPIDAMVRKNRAEGLYQIDRKKEIRLAHENPIIKKVYQEFLNNEKNIHDVCHTVFKKKKKGVIKILPPRPI
ncbi:MAG: [FeFe] hydrogenase, group A [Patescibacteria group bacterium]|jgi:iron only hydrogenase large subunit-like protein|nr:[FeFe] hydrogenase, group A [Patescibacteria group bacterium]MDD5172617.1 [FeFe] hydrogenase, group A [Patescibacteria group bacterium]